MFPLQLMTPYKSRSPSEIQCIQRPINRTDYYTWTQIEEKTCFNFIFLHACKRFTNNCYECEGSRSLLEMGVFILMSVFALCPPKSVRTLTGIKWCLFVGPITYFTTEFLELWRLKLIFGKRFSEISHYRMTHPIRHDKKKLLLKSEKEKPTELIKMFSLTPKFKVMRHSWLIINNNKLILRHALILETLSLWFLITVSAILVTEPR